VFAGTTFDDQASGTPSAPNARNFDYADGEATGPVQPEGALGALVGESPEGPWVLVISDDTGGQQGTLNSWSLTVSTLPVVVTDAPQIFSGNDSSIPNGFPEGVQLPLLVNGLASLLYDVNVTVNIEHDNAADIDLQLTSPAGTTIDLVTDVGGGADDLYAGTTFDDQADDPVSDMEVPEDGTPFAAVVPEGALAAFIGEDPNGIWLLTVADDSGGSSGSLEAWSLTLVTGAATCGNGALDGPEQCDDGNAVDGDGCDSNCTVTSCGNGIETAGEDCDDGNTANGDGCPSTCAFTEVDCSDCFDNDLDGLVDALDPDCRAGEFALNKGKLTFKGPRTRPRDVLALRGTIAVPSSPVGSMSVAIADANGAVACAPLGAIKSNRNGTKLSAKGKGRWGQMTVKLNTKGGGSVSFKGRRLDLSALDSDTVAIGLQIGSYSYISTRTFRPQGARRRVHP
jgi:cysteine-rich repeat protein